MGAQSKCFLPITFVKKVSKLVTSFALLTLITAQALSQTRGLTPGWESYLDRPDILSLQPESLHTHDPNWQKLKAAHFSFIAFLLEAYPSDTKIYFLARDSEHLYDVARLVTKGTREGDRFHLLNVSRVNMRDQNLLPYLKQNGISPERLREGEKVLFVDTGFSGSIPRFIGEAFPEDVRDNLKTHLIISKNSNHPSSRTFLVHLNPTINILSPAQMHGSLISYEHMPRYTDRSSKYELIDETYHPISTLKAATDGEVNKEKSIALMKDLIASWNNPHTRALFKAERDHARWLRQALHNDSETVKLQIKERLRIEDKFAQKIAEAQLQDFFDITGNTQDPFKIKPEDLGLKNITSAKNNSFSKRQDLIKKFPEWAPVLENPVDKIPELFKQKNWQMIGNLIDADVDMQVNKVLAMNLYDGPTTGIKKDLQLLMIEKADPLTARFLAEKTFSQPHTEDMGDLLKLVLEKGDALTFKFLAEKTFSQPHSKKMGNLLKHMIETADDFKLALLAYSTFPAPHTEAWSDLLKLVIEKADVSTLKLLAEKTFSQPHTKDPKFDLLRTAIKIEDSTARKKFLDKNYVNQDFLKEKPAPRNPGRCQALFL